MYINELFCQIYNSIIDCGFSPVVENGIIKLNLQCHDDIELFMNKMINTFDNFRFVHTLKGGDFLYRVDNFSIITTEDDC